MVGRISVLSDDMCKAARWMSCPSKAWDYICILASMHPCLTLSIGLVIYQKNLDLYHYASHASTDAGQHTVSFLFLEKCCSTMVHFTFLES